MSTILAVVPVLNSATPTGTVTFKDGNTVLGTKPLSGGQATFTTTALDAGTRTITASYSGDKTFGVSIATLVQTVNADGTVPASGTTVKNQASHTTPPIQSNETNRSVALYNNVINQFAVQYNPRYTQVYVNGTLTKTYCNIFVWDVTALCAPIPHWVDAKGLPAADYQVGAHEIGGMTP